MASGLRPSSMEREVADEVESIQAECDLAVDTGGERPGGGGGEWPLP
jgi:hypothetical protein